MEVKTLLVLLIAILGGLTLVGIVFTYALPQPGDKERQKSGLYARLYLLFVWCGFIALCMPYIGFNEFHLIGYNLFFTLSSYAVYMTVLKRYGQRLGSGFRFFIPAHLIVVELISWYLHNIALASELFCRGMLFFSALLPLIASTYKMNSLMDVNSQGDKVLFSILLGASVVIGMGGPFYLIYIASDPIYHALVAFGLIVTLMILFMLGFVVSVLHSVVIRLKQQVYLDPLTGCFNRNYLYDIAPGMISRVEKNKQSVCLLACDIDFFKRINDTYGHIGGDKALRHFGKLMREQLHSGDKLIRMGGEEFIVMLPGCSLKDADHFARHLCQTVANTTLQVDGKQISMTASFGVICLAPAQDLFDAINEVDLALYRAKETGRNRVVTLELESPQETVKDMSMAFQ
ncbi:GGDEF domain-containing protein [Salinimonas lutimaris]|uniref:GGDEF domain-containing protein n=1 Tax=Salinimonas lutimaris TaxID=914153 RepID=UPI0010BFDE47|nr:GGDEF domain-containing protein [Salinimonas lutimaris]